MKSTSLQFLYFLDCCINNKKLDFSRFDNWDMGILFKNLTNNGLFSLGFSRYLQLADATGASVDRESLTALSINFSARQMIYNNKLFSLLDKFNDSGLHPVLFKGITLARLYPSVTDRISSDSDILAPAGEFEAMKSILEQSGYQFYEETSKDPVPVYIDPVSSHKVELHLRLWEDYEGKTVDTMKSIGIDNPDTFTTLNISGHTITTLGCENHLIYQLFHIYKHFAIEGISIKYLLDITLYVNTYTKEISFKKFWNKLNKLNYTRFAEVMFSICIKHFHMNSDIMTGHKLHDCEAIDNVIEDFINVGITDIDKGDSWQLLGIMTPYVNGNMASVQKGLRRKLYILFPSSKNISGTYAYAKKYPFLLPVAWVHRFIKFIIDKLSRNDMRYSAGDKMKVAEHRINLLNTTNGYYEDTEHDKKKHKKN